MDSCPFADWLEANHLPDSLGQKLIDLCGLKSVVELSLLLPQDIEDTIALCHLVIGDKVRFRQAIQTITSTAPEEFVPSELPKGPQLLLSSPNYSSTQEGIWIDNSNTEIEPKASVLDEFFDKIQKGETFKGGFPLTPIPNAVYLVSSTGLSKHSISVDGRSMRCQSSDKLVKGLVSYYKAGESRRKFIERDHGTLIFYYGPVLPILPHGNSYSERPFVPLDLPTRTALENIAKSKTFSVGSDTLANQNMNISKNQYDYARRKSQPKLLPSLPSLNDPLSQLIQLVLNPTWDQEKVKASIIMLQPAELIVAVYSPQLVNLMANSTVCSPDQVVFKSMSPVYTDATYSVGKFWVIPVGFLVVPLERVGQNKWPPLCQSIYFTTTSEKTSSQMAIQSFIRTIFPGADRPHISIQDGDLKQREALSAALPNWLNLDCTNHLKKAIDRKDLPPHTKNLLKKDILDSESREAFDHLWNQLPSNKRSLQNPLMKERYWHVTQCHLRTIGFQIDPRTGCIQQPTNSPEEGGHHKMKARLEQTICSETGLPPNLGIELRTYRAGGCGRDFIRQFDGAQSYRSGSCVLTSSTSSVLVTCQAGVFVRKIFDINGNPNFGTCGGIPFRTDTYQPGCTNITNSQGTTSVAFTCSGSGIVPSIFVLLIFALVF